MSSAADIWSRLSEADRQRHAEYYDRTARQAFSHCCSILIGCPHLPTSEARNASGILVSINDHCYIITADHVLNGFWQKLADGGPAHFQIGRLVVNPASRLVYSDKSSDIAAIAIDDAEMSKICKTPYIPDGNWPPSMPKDGDCVQLTGYAAANRINGERGRIENFSLHIFCRVVNARDGQFFAHVERDGIPTENAGLMPPPGDSVGGMSGGPAMLFFQEPLPLIGIVSQMCTLADAIRVSSLANVRFPRRPTVL